MFTLMQASAGTPVSDVWLQLSISEAMIYNWKKRYAGMGGVYNTVIEPIRAASICAVIMLFAGFTGGCVSSTIAEPKRSPFEQAQYEFDRGHFYASQSIGSETNMGGSGLYAIKRRIMRGDYRGANELLSNFQWARLNSAAKPENRTVAEDTALAPRQLLADGLRAETLAHTGAFDQAVELATITAEKATIGHDLSVIEVSWPRCSRSEPCPEIHRETVEALVAASNAFRLSGAMRESRDAAINAVMIGVWRRGYTPDTGYALMAAGKVFSELEDFEQAISYFEYAHLMFRLFGGVQSVHAVDAVVWAADTLSRLVSVEALDNQGDFQDVSGWQAEALDVTATARDAITAANIPTNSLMAKRLDNARARLLLEPQTLFIENVLRKLVDIDGPVADASQEALDIISRNLAIKPVGAVVENALRADSLALAALAASRLKRTEDATRFSEESINTARRALPDQSLSIAARLLDYVDTSVRRIADGSLVPDDKVAESLFIALAEVREISASVGDRMLGGSTPAERAKWTTSRYVQGAVAYLVRHLDNARAQYDAVLSVKGRAYLEWRATIARAHQASKQRGSTHLIEIFDKLRTAVSRESDLIYRLDDGGYPKEGRRSEKMALMNASNAANDQWRRLSAETWSDGGTIPRYSLADIQRSMSPQDVVVDFVRVSAPGLFEQNLAYVYGPTGDPIVVTQLNAGLITVEETLSLMRSAVAQYDSVDDTGFDEMAWFVWKQIWLDIHLAIKKANENAQVVYIVPTRSIAASPLIALKAANGKYLYEHYHLAYLTAAQDLIVEDSHAKEKLLRVVGIGGINYGENDDFFGARRGVAVVGNFTKVLAKSADKIFPAEVGFLSLPNTEPEIDAIRQILGDRAVTSITGDLATEIDVNAAVVEDRLVRILHFATHGFANLSHTPYAQFRNRGIFSSNGVLQVPRGRQSPLLFYGLALAGANTRGRSAESNGILTGAELATWDLSHLDLAVLSACDGGVGPYQTGDGMDGIHRALAYAGAPTQIVSLYPVGDAATRRLMKFFYKELATGRTPASALSIAIHSLRHFEVGGKTPYAAPRNWAAFVAYGPQRLLSPLAEPTTRSFP